MNKLIVQYRNVYGNDVFYPVNDEAKEFAAIAGTKTLAPAVMKAAQRLGFEIICEGNAARLAAALGG